MKNPFTLFNTWYDAIKEPYRFLFFFFVFALPFSFAQVDIRDWHFAPKWLDLSVIVIVVAIVISRMIRGLKTT